jgi:hypothetical protein
MFDLVEAFCHRTFVLRIDSVPPLYRVSCVVPTMDTWQNIRRAPDGEMLIVRRLHDVFSTGKTPEVTYIPRTGGDPERPLF